METWQKTFYKYCPKCKKLTKLLRMATCGCRRCSECGYLIMPCIPQQFIDFEDFLWELANRKESVIL